MTGEDYEARKDEHRPDWPGYKHGIQRWDIWGYEWEQDPHPEGDWVKYDDHVAAVEEAHQRGLSAARDAVAATEAANTSEGPYVFRARALAAIDALRGDA